MPALSFGGKASKTAPSRGKKGEAAASSAASKPCKQAKNTGTSKRAVASKGAGPSKAAAKQPKAPKAPTVKLKPAKRSAAQERLMWALARGRAPEKAAPAEDGFNDDSRPAVSPGMRIVGGVGLAWLVIVALTAGLRHRAAFMRPTGFVEFAGQDGRLYANDVEFSIKGVNWFGSEAFNGPPGGLDKHSIAWYMRFLKSHEFNAVRLLFNHEDVLKDDIVETPPEEASLFQVRYLEMFGVIAREAARHGIIVLVACHRVTPEAWPGEGLWYDTKRGYTESTVRQSWSRVADALCGQWNVFGADLQNEPHASSWGKGLSVDWNKGAERIGNHVLRACPRWLIFVEGVGYTPGAPGGDDPGAGFWWGENLVGAQVAPVQLIDQSKLVYSPHVYGPSVYLQHYFTAPGFPNNMPAVWEQHFAFAQGLGTPIVIGEIGGLYKDIDRQWQDWAIPYLKQRGFGIFYFALNPDSEDTGGLVLDDWSVPGEGSLEAAKLEALAQLPSTDVFELCPECKPADAATDTDADDDDDEARGARGQADVDGGGGLGAGVVVLGLVVVGGGLVMVRRRQQASQLGQRGTKVSTKDEDDDQGRGWAGGHAEEQAQQVEQVEQVEQEAEQEHDDDEASPSAGERSCKGAKKGKKPPKQTGDGTKGQVEKPRVSRKRNASSAGPLKPLASNGDASSNGAVAPLAALPPPPHTVPASSCAAADAAKTLAKGTRVRVHGLVGCAQHNGLEGVVVARADTSSGLRLNVQCDSGEKLRLRPENLQPLHANI